MKRLVWLAMASSLALVACGGGGGGGGPQTGVTTPTPPAPVVCGGAPSSLTCAGTRLALGWSDSATGSNAGVGVGGILDSAFVLDTKATADPSDDQYNGWFLYPSSLNQPYDLTFANLTATNDGLGPLRRASSTDPATGKVRTLEVYDLKSVIGRGLDYIQLAKISGQFMGPDNAGAVTYLALVNWNAQPTLPTTGTANFKGGLRGAYFRNSPDPVNVSGDMAMQVSFAANTFSGAATNMKWATMEGAALTPVDDLQFTFNGVIDRRTYRAPTLIGSASGIGAMAGNTWGGFGGPAGGAPTEAALNFGLYANNLSYRFVGVGGMARVEP